ncbi:MAG: twitch domain-containing radical SAM protein [Saprospiraceae bacterium]
MPKNKPYCLMPWIHFHVGNNGIAKACCVANIPFGNINEQSMDEIWNGEPIQKLREKFATGEKDKRCAQCYKLEAAGGKSIRQETFEKFPDIKIEDNSTPLPIYFDIRFSNICNFRCRTCWHGASSKWYSDAKKLGTNLGEKAIIQNIDDFNLFLQKCGKALLQAEEIYFAGGEPLAMEEHFLLLEWLVENNATQMRLRYNTNFSLLKFKNYDALELWKHFSEVEILASLDGAGALGEYIRKEMSWKTVLENREKIRILPHLKFKISPTISVFNILHLLDFYKECLELKMIAPTDIYFNILERPSHYNIKILPTPIKKHIKKEYLKFFDWIEKNEIPDSVKVMFQECLDYMMAEDLTKYWAKFQTETLSLNKLRDEEIDLGFIQFHKI